MQDQVCSEQMAMTQMFAVSESALLVFVLCMTVHNKLLFTVFCSGLSSIGGSGLGPGGVSSGYVGSYTSPQSVYTSGQSSYASGSVTRQSGYPDLYGSRTEVGCIRIFVVYFFLYVSILSRKWACVFMPPPMQYMGL